MPCSTPIMVQGQFKSPSSLRPPHISDPWPGLSLSVSQNIHNTSGVSCMQNSIIQCHHAPCCLFSWPSQKGRNLLGGPLSASCPTPWWLTSIRLLWGGGGRVSHHHRVANHHFARVGSAQLASALLSFLGRGVAWYILLILVTFMQISCAFLPCDFISLKVRVKFVPWLYWTSQSVGIFGCFLLWFGKDSSTTTLLVRLPLLTMTHC